MSTTMQQFPLTTSPVALSQDNPLRVAYVVQPIDFAGGATVVKFSTQNGGAAFDLFEDQIYGRDIFCPTTKMFAWTDAGTATIILEEDMR